LIIACLVVITLVFYLMMSAGNGFFGYLDRIAETIKGIANAVAGEL